MIREHFSIILAYKLILHDRRVYFQADTFGGSKVQHFGNAACLCQAKPRQKNGALLALFLCRIRIPTLRCLLEIFVLKVPCLMSLFIFKFSGPPNHVVWHQVWGDFHFIHSFFLMSWPIALTPTCAFIPLLPSPKWLASFHAQAEPLSQLIQPTHRGNEWHLGISSGFCASITFNWAVIFCQQSCEQWNGCPKYQWFLYINGIGYIYPL